jgi:hypothetical protein
VRGAFERGDAFRFAVITDVAIDLGGSNVDVAGKYADDFERDAVTYSCIYRFCNRLLKRSGRSDAADDLPERERAPSPVALERPSRASPSSAAPG